MNHLLEQATISRRLLDIHGTINPKVNEFVPVPVLPDYQSINALFGTDTLWTTVGCTSYVPRQVVKKLIVRKDNIEPDQDGFSVFMNYRQKILKDRVFAEPASVKPKQRFQFYESIYALVLLASIIATDDLYASTSRDAPLDATSRIAYAVNPNVSREVLIEEYAIFYSNLVCAYST